MSAAIDPMWAVSLIDRKRAIAGSFRLIRKPRKKTYECFSDLIDIRPPRRADYALMLRVEKSIIEVGQPISFEPRLPQWSTRPDPTYDEIAAHRYRKILPRVRGQFVVQIPMMDWAEAIYAATGYMAIHNRQQLNWAVLRLRPRWQVSAHQVEALLRKAELSVYSTGYGQEWFYLRDVIASLPPRPKCAMCGRRWRDRDDCKWPALQEDDVHRPRYVACSYRCWADVRRMACREVKRIHREEQWLRDSKAMLRRVKSLARAARTSQRAS